MVETSSQQALLDTVHISMNNNTKARHTGILAKAI
jgi:hypothetical protein